MNLTKNDIWQAYYSSNWQGPLFVSFLGFLASGIESGNPFPGLIAGFFALPISYALSLLIGVPILFFLRACNFLSKPSVFLAATSTGVCLAIFFWLDVNTPIYSISAFSCCIFSGWFGSKSLFDKQQVATKVK